MLLKQQQQLLTKISDYQDFLKNGSIIQLLIAQNYKIYIDFCSSIPGKECGHSRIIHQMEILLISSQYSTTAPAGI